MMEHRISTPDGRSLSVGFGALGYSVRPGSPLWAAIEADDLKSVQVLAADIAESGVNIFSVAAAVLDASGRIALVNVLGLACECEAVETAVWLYQQIPSFLPLESFVMSTQGFLSTIDKPEVEKRLEEIARRCLEWNFTGFHEDRIKRDAPLKRLAAGPVAAKLFMDIGLRLEAAHDRKRLQADTPHARVRLRAAARSARL